MHFPHPLPIVGSRKNLLLTLLNLLNNLLPIILKASSRNLIQSQNLLIRVLNKHVFAFVTLKTHISDRADDTPAIGELEVHLLCEVAGLPTDDAEDDVTVVGLGVCAGDESIRVSYY
jgi:hypothetical protein